MEARTDPGSEAYGTYLALRRQVLAIDSRSLGSEPDGSALAFVMDLVPAPGETASLTAVRDGTASLLLSSGGQVAPAQPEVAALASSLVGEARRYGARMKRSDEAPLPAEGSVRFNLVTEAVVLAADESEDELASGASPLADLYREAHRLLAAIRLAAGEGR